MVLLFVMWLSLFYQSDVTCDFSFPADRLPGDAGLSHTEEHPGLSQVRTTIFDNHTDQLNSGEEEEELEEEGYSHLHDSMVFLSFDSSPLKALHFSSSLVYLFFISFSRLFPFSFLSLSSPSPVLFLFPPFFFLSFSSPLPFLLLPSSFCRKIVGSHYNYNSVDEWANNGGKQDEQNDYEPDIDVM